MSTPLPRPDRLLSLFHHRWAVPLLSELLRTDGSRFVTLTNRLQVPRDSLQRTLAALIENGLVERNPGYGHPLRPEYILTSRGAAVARGAAPLHQLLRSAGVEEIGLRKWSMPLIAALSGGQRRFSELKAAYSGLTARALALALKDLESSGLVNRRIVESYPPTTSYELTRAGRRFGRVLRRLARVSGMQHHRA